MSARPAAGSLLAAALIALTAAILITRPAAAQTPAGTVLEESVAPGRNYDKAEFKLWLPNDVASVQAIALLVPGSWRSSASA